MSLTARQQQLLDDLVFIDDLQERLATVVERARRRPKLSAEQRTPAHRIPGCTSNVWLVSQLHEGRCHFHPDADSPVVLGLVTLLTDFHSDLTPAELLATTTDPLETLQLSRNLSPTRRHGLAAVRTALRAFAAQQLSSLNSQP